MLPTNKFEHGCDPISSNCVIWEGPDIECIDLCKGDSITDVVYKLATELCTIMDYLDVKEYELLCLTACPEPKNFKELIQIIINKLCDLEDCCDPEPTPQPAFAEASTEVPIASCFYFVNEQGDTVTTMAFADYVTTIGNRVCTIVSQIITINATLENHETRITALENEPEPVFVLPTMIPDCVLPAIDTPIDEVLIALEAQFCELRAATGLPNEIFFAISQECPGLINSPRLGPTGGVMGTIPGWVNIVQNLADSINNMWLTICDLRAAVTAIQANCCPTGCDGIELTLSAELEGTILTIYFTGTIPPGFTECDPAGTMVTIRDTDGHQVTQLINVVAILNSVGGFPLDISGSELNTALDFTLSADVCLENAETNAECRICVEYVLVNTLDCPSPVTLTPGTTTIGYSFNHITGVVTYTVELYDETGAVLLASNTHDVNTAQTVSGSFSGLASSTTYKIRIVITAGSKTKNCQFNVTTTLSQPCSPPSGITVEVETIET